MVQLGANNSALGAKNRRQYSVIDVRVAMQLTGKSSSTANRYIGRLVELGVLVQEGQSKSTVYRRA